MANSIINRLFFVKTMTWEVVINVIPIIPLLGVYQIHKPLLGMCEWRFHAIFGFAKNGLTSLTGFPISRGKKKIVYLMFGQFLDGWVPTRLPILDGSINCTRLLDGFTTLFRYKGHPKSNLGTSSSSIAEALPPWLDGIAGRGRKRAWGC